MRTTFSLRAILGLSLCFCFWSTVGYSAEVAVLQQRGRLENWEQQVGVACRFYGVDLKVLTVGDRRDEQEVIETLRKRSTVAAIASATALSLLDKRAILSALKRSDRDDVPLMILGITAATDVNFLKLWSDGAIIASEGPETISSTGSYQITDMGAVARQLAGQRLLFSGGSAYGLDLDSLRSPQTIISVRDTNHDLPVFVRVQDSKQDLYFQAHYTPSASSSSDLVAVFPSIAPILMFVRYASGEYAWHSMGHYANLTIDDPWLIEPYGNLDYRGLLQEMEKFNFHTTISFIPWNFDRSRPDVVSLFRDHPDRYSIAVHGDNHDHEEFGDYQKAPLSDQVAALRQAVARMEAFKTLTELSYDRVMVWPHEVVPPASTLGFLKEYNFLGNVNQDPVPLGSDSPSDLLFLLRSANLRFSNFPTVRRFFIAPGSMESTIAINAFLENPILLWRDQDFFFRGINAFDDTAALVNHIQPDSIWASLGSIMRHLFLVKLREGSDYDVMAFSSQIRLENPEEHSVRFFLQKDESFGVPLKSLTVGGEPYPYRRSGDSLLLDVAVPAKQSRDVVVTYDNDLDVSRVDLSKSSLRINLLRRISDFRDLELSRNPVGAAAIRFYYSHLFSDKAPIERVLDVMLSVFLALGAILLGRRFVRRPAKVKET